MPPTWTQERRLGGLRRFAVAITVLNVLGHAWLGFEHAYAHPLVGVGTAYAMELALELVDARAHRRRPAFAGGFQKLVDFLLSAHITGLAVAMLLYPGDRLMPVAFGAAVAIGSKAILRVRVDGRSRHILNPSNFGIAVTLLAFPWVGISAPYMFTENLGPVGDWLLPSVIVVSGTFLNARFTGKLPLIGAWISGFVLQALLRHWFLGASIHAALMPMSGLAFLLFTFYMVTDPATTPVSVRGQVAFGLSVAAAYATLMVSHVVFGLFFGLALVSLGRGAALQLGAWLEGLRASDALSLPATAEIRVPSADAMRSHES